jgi:cbb3-type cytochrome oxidase maturation protein
MSVLYIMLPAALFVAAGAVLAFIMAARGGQYDDLETPAYRMLPDDDASPATKAVRRAEDRDDGRVAGG